jgi:hypothetical protein
MEYQGYPTADELLAKQTSDPDMFKALAYGAAAGITGAALWYAIVSTTQHELGIIAIGIGWLVAQGVVLGSGRKRGMNLQVLSVLLTVAAMAGAEYFILRDQLVAYVLQKYGAESAARVPVFLPLDVAWDFVTSAIQDDAGTLVFWAIAVFTAFRIPAPLRIVPAAAPAPTPNA